MAVLDVGAGAHPTVPPNGRPRLVYDALEISSEELAKAPRGAYTNEWVGDVTQFDPQFEGRYDLVLCFHVLEHVESTESTLSNIRTYLRPRGRMIALLGGTFSLHGLANRLLPDAVAQTVARSTTSREPGTIFPGRYRGCYATALEASLEPWESYEVIPLYLGAWYLNFSPVAQRLYLAYENWAYRNGHRNLATHYVIDATR